MSRPSESPDFPDVNLVAQLMIDLKKFPGENISELKNNPEFQVFRIIGEHKTVSVEEIEEKLSIQSLSMILSNLQADDLIAQTEDYRWKLTDSIVYTIQSELSKVSQKHSEQENHQEVENQRKAQNNKKSLYKQIADQISDSSYIQSYASVEDLFKVPELEILAIIYKNSTIQTSDIENLMTLETSVSLALSNLQADNYIEQNDEYKWRLSQELQNNIESSNFGLSSKVNNQQGDGSDNTISLSNHSIIAHKQLLKALIDLNYFESKTIDEIIRTPEFEILNIINMYSPISSEEIETKLSRELLISLLLSNLSADGLIKQSNDIRWVLTEDLRIRVSKVKVSHEELLTQLQEERGGEGGLKEDNIIEGEGHRQNTKTESEDSDKSSLPIDPILEQLIIYNYVKENNTNDFENISEYKVLATLAINEALGSDEISSLTNSPMVSLTLSNLVADKLIRQREGDFKYELTENLSLGASYIQELKEKLETQSAVQEEKIEKERINTKSPDPTETPQKLNRNINMVKNLRIASEKIGYIEDRDASLNQLLKIPEFEILKIIAENNPVDNQTIKDLTTSVSPVLVSRTLSKLEAEERISREPNSTWIISKAFEKVLIEDVMEERRKAEELKKAQLAKERAQKIMKEKERRVKFTNLLNKEGVIEGDLSQEQLMDIPEFELLWIISQNDEGISEVDIKRIAKIQDPFLIIQTLTKLEVKGRIQKTLNGNYELSSDLKS